MVSGQPLSFWIARLGDPDTKIALEAAGKASMAEDPAAAVGPLRNLAHKETLTDPERGFAAAMLYKTSGETDRRFVAHLARTQISANPLGEEYDVVTQARLALAKIAKTDPQTVTSEMAALADGSQNDTPASINMKYFFTSVWPESLPHLKNLPENQQQYPAIAHCIRTLETR